MKIVAATRNENKLREFKELLPQTEILSPVEAGADIEIVEDGATFEENALKKARGICAASGLPALADDSGLETDALGGEPGVHSARYGGEGLTDAQRTRLVLEKMRAVPEGARGARFICVIAFVDGERELVARGECEGEIAFSPAGKNGFGYDPVFYVKAFEKTMAQMSADEKNAISHRGRALLKMKEKLSDL